MWQCTNCAQTLEVNFTFAAFADWCACNGIKHKLTPPYVPKANGLIERFHGTIMPRLRAVNAGRRLPRAAIPELFVGLVYLYNRLPNSAAQDKKPSEVYQGEDSTLLAHLRVLGAKCCTVVPDVLGKLAPRSSPGILVGYASPGRGKNAVYRVWNTAQVKVEEAIDVYFDERPLMDAPAPAAPAPAAPAPAAPVPVQTPLQPPVAAVPAPGHPRSTLLICFRRMWGRMCRYLRRKPKVNRQSERQIGPTEAFRRTGTNPVLFLPSLGNHPYTSGKHSTAQTGRSGMQPATRAYFHGGKGRL
jgi:hypothetical protein